MVNHKIFKKKSCETILQGIEVYKEFSTEFIEKSLFTLFNMMSLKSVLYFLYHQKYILKILYSLFKGRYKNYPFVMIQVLNIYEYLSQNEYSLNQSEVIEIILYLNTKFDQDTNLKFETKETIAILSSKIIIQCGKIEGIYFRRDKVKDYFNKQIEFNEMFENEIYKILTDGYPNLFNCSNCKKVEKENDTFGYCIHCQICYYCSNECKDLHWGRIHKEECPKK
jgi:hypothetical protein